jgi:hypothetical protein
MRGRTRPLWWLPLVMGLAALACGASEPPASRHTGGTGGTAGAGGTGGGGGADSAFAPVQAIFDQHCVWCHDPTHPFAGDNPTFIEMPLVADQSYDALVGVAAHETCGGTRVIPGDPEHSYLYRKVADDSPCDGYRMPRPGAVLAQPLPATDIATIHDWIAGGARP